MNRNSRTDYRLAFWCRLASPTNRVSNGLDPDQVQHSVGPDLGPNCLHRTKSGKDLALCMLAIFLYTVKPALSGHLKIDKTKGLKSSGNFMQV